MVQVRIDVDTARVEQLLVTAPDKLNDAMRRALKLSTIETQREMRQKVHVGVTGDARNSIRADVTGLTGTVGPTAKYALPLETGSRPHWVSIKNGSSLKKWADIKGIPARAVQLSIARKGTKPHPFVKPTATLMEPRIHRYFDQGIDKVIGELNRE
ncbi:HK97 gp10 family phage protein [Rhodococcus qingshengii]|uniref:HK97 gp10 family phage protein n=1 Tax=Rhodococcus qingshengii TaxID=334542 RepID=UPI00294243E5|nr:HK97 gp10 family phage protein [Rhodococcus qingshengii]WOI85993.1 HK97 gp10 family phage protein [Rhodococcus qingshengii]